MPPEPKYKNSKEFDIKANEYFDLCDKKKSPYSWAELAWHLGFASKQSLYDYEKKKAFSYSIKRARLKIEGYAEKRLYDRDGSKGAEFNLRCNFGWRDNDDVGNDGKEVNIIDDI